MPGFYITFLVDSSPLARGTHFVTRLYIAASGFIPSCEGNTGQYALSMATRKIHPLLRGEHPQKHLDNTKLIDSSPLARGTLLILPFNPKPCRFIPSCEGNTASLRQLYPKTQIHPFLRGEHLDEYHQHKTTEDSSPLARGTQYTPHLPASAVRFIPSCEGNTQYRPAGQPNSRIHPLLRGEHNFLSCPDSAASDSSPLTRGTRA